MSNAAEKTEATPVVVPTFDLDSFNTVTEAEFEEVLAAGNRGKFLAPGRHEVTIDDVEIRGVAKSDPDWMNLQITFKGTEDRTIRDFLMVPTTGRNKFKYGEKKSPGPFANLSKFMGVLGIPLSFNNVREVISGWLMGDNVKRLKGLNLTIEVGYRGAHVKWVRKDGESNVYQILMGNGQELIDEKKQVLEFPSRDAAKAQAASMNIALQDFPRVLTYSASSTPNTPNGKAVDENW